MSHRHVSQVRHGIERGTRLAEQGMTSRQGCAHAQVPGPTGGHHAAAADAVCVRVRHDCRGWSNVVVRLDHPRLKMHRFHFAHMACLIYGVNSLKRPTKRERTNNELVGNQPEFCPSRPSSNCPLHTPSWPFVKRRSSSPTRNVSSSGSRAS